MNSKDFTQAIEIISRYYSTKISIKEPVKDHISQVHDILIHECCPAVINELINNGYSLHMCDKGLSVSKY